MGQNREWISELSEKQQSQLLEIISDSVEHELLNDYIISNKLPFCIKDCKMPFNVKRYSTAFTIRLVEMIKNGELILADAKV